MSRRERAITSVLVLAAAVGLFGTVYKVNQRFSVVVPDEGGRITEGVIGSPHFVNPILAIADADRDIVNLIYAGLMKPDGKGGLVPELAERYEISEDGLSYTFFLRDAKFHDGEKLTADDIIFTIESAKSPVIKSPMRAGWEGVEMEKIDEKTIRFWLKRPYAPFLENTTIGILPRHLWKDVPQEQISLSELNLNPVGAGPYKIANTNTSKGGTITSYSLRSFPNYVMGEPFIRKITLMFYPSEVELLNAYESGDVDSASAISPQNIAKIRRQDGEIKSLNLPRVFGVFFNQNEKTIFLEKPVRQALDMAVDKDQIVREVLGGYARTISSPIPLGSFGAIETASSTYNLDQAKALLEKNGWTFNADKGVYEKVEKGTVTGELSFSISTSNAPDLVRAADIIKSNWEKLGAKVEVKVFEISDLNQNVIRTRKYDALLFGEVVGREPDPFAFWHSSQRNDPGLNIALYTSATVDKLLEEARGLTSRAEREEKYHKFQEQVAADTPSVFLYSPAFVYIVPENLKGFDTENIATPAERFTDIFKWYFDTKYVWKIFQKDN
ncbi:hypothetical protein A3B18_02135 [Candidatus Giovannonibacteria bacterium RIFCSPLOWO2_01_FULL_46_13]|uniref:Solute-binding protein family 5 domain-containing protein n=1 Tax=Candidatus Giovannonibacteria bacterium RIFCSPLOWO2_01_FULL_46_13 TaxID=1798352 RepID=A0A1F5X4N0_9BACT|nr:MAG: hypothetical protein A3B18_02135 [Candidatus Giovannonibacteria bacterium RIFCSPLOWO2_01_FULL_46_13]